MVPRNGEPKKCDFSKSVVLLRRQHDFWGSGVPTKDKKHEKMRKRARGGQKTWFWEHFLTNFGSFGGPSGTQGPKGRVPEITKILLGNWQNRAGAWVLAWFSIPGGHQGRKRHLCEKAVFLSASSEAAFSMMFFRCFLTLEKGTKKPENH